jgi:hypothetical protein
MGTCPETPEKKAQREYRREMLREAKAIEDQAAALKAQAEARRNQAKWLGELNDFQE